MVKKGNDGFLKYSSLFERRIPQPALIIALLTAVSIVMGIASAAIIENSLISSKFYYILSNGAIIGIISIVMPTILTAIVMKIAESRISIKHILFVSLIPGITYSIFLLLGSILYIIAGAGAAVIAVIVGDASIFSWWVFVNRIMMGPKKRMLPAAFVQPTLNILFYIPASRFLFSVVPYFNNLLVRLYAAIAIFGIMIYAIFYMINSPMRRSLGFGSIDAFSLMFQDWVFDISVGNAFNPKFGQPTDISVDTLVFKSKKGIRGIMFLPYIHYGPAGSIGGSMFPRILEDYARHKYGSVSFIMHPGVNVDFNPVASSQAAVLKKALDDGVANAAKVSGRFAYMKGAYGDSHIDRLRFGDSELDIISRAPRVTEDVSPEAAAVIKGVAEADGINAAIVDAHNSRYETAPKEELDGVGFNSKQQQEYVEAFRSSGEVASSDRLRAGFACESIFEELDEPQDIADGMMNSALFAIGEKSYALLQFNANNMLPALRNQIVKHVKTKYGIDAEVCTTDTHAVNSLGMTASNVLGRSTSFRQLKPHIDSCIRNAMKSMEEVDVMHSRGTVKNFKVWGRNVQDRIATVLDSVIAMGRVVIPAIIVGGFIAAIWIVSLV